MLAVGCIEFLSTVATHIVGESSKKRRRQPPPSAPSPPPPPLSPSSPSSCAAMTEFVEAILAQIIGNISTAIIVVLFYFNFLLFENYLRLIVWAILFSQALRQAKTNVISVLQYLSDDPNVDKDGFLTSVFSKSCEIFLRHPNGPTRSAKELFLNYGIFIFSLIGAVSIWMRMYSWVSFLNIAIGFWIVSLSLIKLLERRIFYYRYFISDEVLVSTLLILGFFTTGAFVVLYLGTESYLEGSRAAAALSDWVQTNFINDERTRQVWSEQVENSRLMISSAISGVEDRYNDTMWWPPLRSMVKAYYLDNKPDFGNATSQVTLYSRLRLPENMTLIQAFSLAYSKVDTVNLTSVQLTDWTSKGLEVSSIAFGSVAQLVLLVFTMLIAFVSLGIRAFFFISSLFYLLCTKWDPIERFVHDLLPIGVGKRPHVVHSLRKVVEGVFFLPLKMSSIHALVTLLSFTIVNADFVYLATTFTFFISIVPIIPPYLYIAFTVLDDMLYEKSIVALNSYVSALSVVFGVYVFGIEGVIFGPLSVCGVYFAYEVSNHGIQAAQDEFRGSDENRADARGDSELDEVDDVQSTHSSHEEDKEDLLTASQNSNIFSNAMYRVISGPLAERVRRRFSMDITTEDSVCVTLVVEGLKTQKRIRFVVNKAWTQKALYDSIRRMLHVQGVEGIKTPDGTEVLSPMHIFPNEILHVTVRPKPTRSHHTYLDTASVMSDSNLRLPLHNGPLSTRKRAQSGQPSGSSVFSPTGSARSIKKGASASGFPTMMPTLAVRKTRGRLRRQNSVPIHADSSPHLRRRRSFCVEVLGQPCPTTDESSNGASPPTSSDLPILPTTRSRSARTLHRRSSAPIDVNGHGSGSESTVTVTSTYSALSRAHKPAAATIQQPTEVKHQYSSPKKRRDVLLEATLLGSPATALASPSREDGADVHRHAAQSPSSAIIRRLLEEEEAAYVAKRADRKVIDREYASKKLNSPIKAQSEHRGHSEHKPAWLSLFDVEADESSDARGVEDDRISGRTTPHGSVRSSGRRPNPSTSLHDSKLTPHPRPTSKAGKLVLQRSLHITSAPHLPRLSTPGATPTAGSSRHGMSRREADETSVAAAVDEVTALIQQQLPPGFLQGKGKVHLHEHLHDFHSRQVFSCCKHPAEDLELQAEQAQQLEIERLIAHKPLDVQERVESVQRTVVTKPGEFLLSPTVPLTQGFIIGRLRFITMLDYDDIFEYDWALNEVDKVVRDAVERQRINVVLKKSYRVLLWFFRYYAGKSASAAMSGQSAPATGPVDLFQVPDRLKLLEDLNVQCVDPTRYGITEAPLKRENLIGFLLSVAKMNCLHPSDPARMRMLIAEGIELSEAIKTLVRDHFGAYAQVQDVNHFRFLFLKASPAPTTGGATPKLLRQKTRQVSRRLGDIIAKHQVNLMNFYLEQINVSSGAPATATIGHFSQSSTKLLLVPNQRVSMKYSHFLQALKSIGLIPKHHATTAVTPTTNTGGKLDETRLLRVFLSCLGMKPVETADSDGIVGTREATFEQFVEALCRVALMKEEIEICKGEYDVCPGQITSDWCQCIEVKSSYAFERFDDAVEELFDMIHSFRMKHAANKRTNITKMRSLRTLYFNPKSTTQRDLNQLK
ncbi:TPA: hypothetical protein N0F65_002897 [Lagenidium giganteum]|uniref:Uncharacterized protein n=1 Tax=Lagenidium giganteum TaxID=4803 RepID=A0AAV2ZBT6_9STRA|nr:TPA: hypothetical protein N0F65_002897 [Lagenidium giganteum]